MSNQTVKFEDGDLFVEGKEKMSYGFRKRVKNMQRPSKLRYKGDDDIIVHMDEYDLKNDPDVYILQSMLTDWSGEGNVTRNRIVDDEDHGELFDKYLEYVKKLNGIIEDKEGKSEEDTN
jgi:hypothetical protein